MLTVALQDRQQSLCRLRTMKFLQCNRLSACSGLHDVCLSSIVVMQQVGFRFINSMNGYGACKVPRATCWRCNLFTLQTCAYVALASVAAVRLRAASTVLVFANNSGMQGKNFFTAPCYSSERIKFQCVLLIGITDKRLPRRTSGKSDNSRCDFNSFKVMMRFSVRTCCTSTMYQRGFCESLLGSKYFSFESNAV